MTAASSYGVTQTAQPSGVAECHIVQAPLYTVAGTQVAPGQPNMMIVYKRCMQGFRETGVVYWFDLIPLLLGTSRAFYGTDSLSFKLIPITAENLCKLSVVPIQVECPHCRRTAVTEVEKVVGTRAEFMACLLGPLVCGCGPCLLYEMWDGLKDRVHRCGSCKHFIAERDINVDPTLSRGRF